jgi:hypothetical protein
MKLIVNSLIESVKGIMNVIVIILFIWVIFAILFMNTLKDTQGYCNGIENYEGVDKAACDAGLGRWTRFDMNFDNF